MAKKAAEGSDRPKVLIMCAVDFTVRQFLMPLAIHLKAQGCDVSVACTPGEYWDELKGRGLKMVPLPLARNMNVLSHLVTAMRLRAYIKKHQPDIIHVHTPIAGLIGRIVGRMMKVPLIIYTAHGFYFHDRMPGWKYRAHVMLEKFAGKFHDALFCVSQEDADAAERLGIERPSRITLVRNGVEPNEFLPTLLLSRRSAKREELGIPEEAPVVIFVGRMTREKGILEFLQAARDVREKVPEAHFLVAGGILPSERDRVRKEVDRLANEPSLKGRMHLLGFRSDVAELLAASDLFCLPSYREGLPVSVIEAMMIGLPVIATNIRGCREAVMNGTTGLLVEPRNERDLAGAMTFLLTHADIAKRLGAAGQHRAEEFYTLRRHLDVQWDTYRRLMAEKLP